MLHQSGEIGLHNDDFPDDDVDTDVLTSAQGPKHSLRPASGQAQSSQQSQQQPASKGPRHSLRPSSTGGMEAVSNPPAGQSPNTGGFAAQRPTTGGQQQVSNTGSVPQQQVSNTGSMPQQQVSNTGSMPQQQVSKTGSMPQQQRPDTGMQAGFRKDTSGFMAVQRRSAEPEEEVDFQLRIIYAGSGFGVGLLLGVGLGVLNSVLENIDPMQGLGLTLQIAVWLGLIVGIVAGWKPRRFDNAWNRLMSGLGLDD